MQIIKVRYWSATKQQLTSREYTYFAEDEGLKVGDTIKVPARDTIVEAQVSTVNVPESEIAAYRDMVRTIPAAINPDAEKPGSLAEAARQAEDAVTEAKDKNTAIIKVNPLADTSVIQLQEEAVKLLEYAQKRIISRDEDLSFATDDLTIIAKVRRALQERKEDFYRPIKANLDNITQVFQFILDPLENADRINRDKIKEYRAAVLKQQQEAEEINRQKEALARREIDRHA